MQFKHHHHRNSKTRLLACGVQWYGCLGRRPGTQTVFFGIVQFKHHRPRYPKTPWGTMLWVFGAPPQTASNMFWHCAVQTASSEELKNTFASLWGAVVLVLGAPPQNTNNIFWHCAVQWPSAEDVKNTFASLWGTMVWVFGAPPQNPNNIFWHCALQTSPS